MDDKLFVIKDLQDFINATRRLVFHNFGTNSEEDSNLNLEKIMMNMSTEDEQEMDKVLSYSESYSIILSHIKTQKNKKTSKSRYVLNENIYMSIITSLNERLVSNILNSLVNRGLVETAYDEKTNDFVFWVKDSKTIN